MPKHNLKWIAATLSAVWLMCVTGVAANQGATQATVLADLSGQIVTCAIHPCLGEDEEAIRALLSDRVVTDDIYYYSDLNMAYPRTTGSLTGLVEWSEGGIYFKIVGFHVPPTVLLNELEHALPGCEMDQDDDRVWSCTTTNRDSVEAFVEVFFAPGLVLLELDP